MSAWTKLEPLTEKPHAGCLHCGPKPKVAPMEMIIAVGFGDATVKKDGELIYQEDMHDDSGEFRTLAEFEAMAKADPDHDWRVHLFAPLSEAEWQRHGDGQWVMVRQGIGFA